MSAASDRGAIDASDEGPERWCYDALEPRTWTCGMGQLSLLRSLELVWITFDSNPAYFANRVEGEQAIEDFLVGPPAAATPSDLLDEVRAYVRGVRTPGRSTWLALEVADDVPFLGVWWRIDGANPEACPLPGPASAGVYGGAPAWRRRGMRSLVRPGKVDVLVGITLAARHEPTELTCTLHVSPGTRHQLRVAADRDVSSVAHGTRLVIGSTDDP